MTIFKTGYLQALDVTDELIKIIEDNNIITHRQSIGVQNCEPESYLESRIKQLIYKYCRRTGRIPFEIEDETDVSP